MTSANTDFKCYALPIIEKDRNLILGSSFDFNISAYTAQPLCSLGYNYFMHQSYTNFDKKIKETGNKTYYWVVNSNEILLTNPENRDDLLNGLKKYFDKEKVREEVLTNPIFLQIWELLLVHDLLDAKSNKINMISNHGEVVKEVLNGFSKKIYKKETISFTDKGYDLGIFTFDNFMTVTEQEPHYFPIMMQNINKLLHGLKPSGSLIININDTFTQPTAKLISLLVCLFDTVFIHKPTYVRLSSSEKYLVCVGLSEKSYNMVSKKLDKLMEKLVTIKMEQITDIMTDIHIPREMMIGLSYVNKKIATNQHKYENKIMTYINSEEHFGEVYNEYSDIQIASTDYFVSTFLPIDSTDYVEVLKKIKERLTDNCNSMKSQKN